MMHALVKKEAKPGLWLEQREEPITGPGEIKIRVHKAAICGTDLHIYNWDEWAQRTIRTPLIIGHEFMGTVVEVGPGIQHPVAIGDRVSCEGHITCGACRNCRAGKRHLCRLTLGTGVNRNGAFAEYVVMPAINAFRLPDSISDELGAIFDPYGNAVHTALSYDLVGEDVLITGAGPVGLMAAAVAKHVGARNVVITDPNESRLALARKLGATYTVNPTKTSLETVMKEIGMTEGFDVGLEMSGNGPAFNSLLRAMNHGGKVVLLGILPNNTAIDWDEVIFKGLFLKGIYGREMFETWYKMAALLQSGLDIRPVITHRFSYQEFEKGFALLRSGEAAKIVLDFIN